MVRFISNIPIFRRLFIAFAIAALIPGIVIVLLGNFYIGSLNTRGQAVRTSFDAQSVAAQEETNLERMNKALGAFYYEVYGQLFGSLGGVQIDPSFFNSGALIGGEVLQNEAEFSQAIVNYPGTYEILNSPNMSTIKSILTSDDPTNGNNVINAQKAALDGARRLWPQYQTYQDRVLKDLEALQTDLQNGNHLTRADIYNRYNQDYEQLALARDTFTDLRNSWLQVVNSVGFDG